MRCLSSQIQMAVLAVIRLGPWAGLVGVVEKVATMTIVESWRSRAKRQFGEWENGRLIRRRLLIAAAVARGDQSDSTTET